MAVFGATSRSRRPLAARDDPREKIDPGPCRLMRRRHRGAPNREIAMMCSAVLSSATTECARRLVERQFRHRRRGWRASMGVISSCGRRREPPLTSRPRAPPPAGGSSRHGVERDATATSRRRDPARGRRSPLPKRGPRPRRTQPAPRRAKTRSSSAALPPRTPVAERQRRRRRRGEQRTTTTPATFPLTTVVPAAWTSAGLPSNCCRRSGVPGRNRRARV